MATTYNFTVRAEDDQGAFADRDFSIIVKNTSVDRYMVVDNTDAYTSPDMVTWTKRIGQGGYNVQYGGGKWMIQYGTHDQEITYRLSTDGINFTIHTVNFILPDTGLAATGVGFISNCPPVWNNGYWWAATTVTNPTRYIIIKSADGINWTAAASLPSYPIGLPSFEGKTIHYNLGATSSYAEFDTESDFGPATTVSPSLPNGVYHRYYQTAPRKINDLWVIVAGVGTSIASNNFSPVYSPDKITWYQGTAPAYPSTKYRNFDTVSYHNGVIFAYGISSGDTAMSLFFSEDGKEWKSIGAQSPYTGYRSNLVFAKGKLWFIAGQVILSSDDLGETWKDAKSSFPISIIRGFATIR